MSAYLSPPPAKHTTALTYTGDTQGDFNDPVTLAATLLDTTLRPPVPVAGAIIALALGSGPNSPTCMATTNVLGTGACSVRPNQMTGAYPLSASFGGTAQYSASSYLSDRATAYFFVTLEETTLAITSSVATGSVLVKASLREDGTTPIGGRTVTFGAGALTASAATDATGAAIVTLPLAPGQYTVSASFAGDAFYRPSTAAAQSLRTPDLAP